MSAPEPAAPALAAAEPKPEQRPSRRRRRRPHRAAAAPPPALAASGECTCQLCRGELDVHARLHLLLDVWRVLQDAQPVLDTTELLTLVQVKLLGRIHFPETAEFDPSVPFVRACTQAAAAAQSYREAQMAAMRSCQSPDAPAASGSEAAGRGGETPRATT